MSYGESNANKNKNNSLDGRLLIISHQNWMFSVTLGFFRRQPNWRILFSRRSSHYSSLVVLLTFFVVHNSLSEHSWTERKQQILTARSSQAPRNKYAPSILLIDVPLQRSRLIVISRVFFSFTISKQIDFMRWCLYFVKVMVTAKSASAIVCVDVCFLWMKQQCILLRCWAWPFIGIHSMTPNYSTRWWIHFCNS